MSGVINKYLNHYSESETYLAQQFPDRFYDEVLIIPVYRENTDFLYRLIEKPLAKKFLLILVSNHPDNLSGETLKNALLCHSQICDQLGSPAWSCGHLSLYIKDAFDVLLVNRTGENSIEAKFGVGLARKIGADIGLALFSANKISNPWFGVTDADTRIPKTYFDVEHNDQSAALLYPFEHISDNSEVAQATMLYEKTIRHYVKGLDNAGSVYAFHTIGSLMAINFDAYARVRGYPKRAAGEDFYLINKLAKIGQVQSLEGPKILIEARTSDRTPFGTGPSVRRLLNSEDMLKEPVFYNPQIFKELSMVLSCYQAKNISEISSNLESLPEYVRDVLAELDIYKMLSAALRQKYKQPQLVKHINDWFDGFKTLKFVHLMRDKYFPNLSYRDLFDKKTAVHN